MSRFALIESEIVTRIIVAHISDTLPAGTWIIIDSEIPKPSIGWSYSGGVFSPPPAAPVTYRTDLSTTEWISSWTPGEWSTLRKAYDGDLTPSPMPENEWEIFVHLMDVIRADGGGIDVASTKANQFYNYLEGKGFISAARKDELQEGIAE